MSFPTTATRLVSPLRRLVATVAAALVLVLALLAGSPALHAEFHDCGHAHAPDHGALPPHDDGCAISLFAQGVNPAPAPFALTVPVDVGRIASFAAPAAILLDRPCFLRPPGRGPPAR